MRLISDLLAVRSQCLEMSTMQKNRLKRMPASVHAPIKAILKSIQSQVTSIERKIDKLTHEVPEWKAQRDLLLSANGVVCIDACMRKQLIILNAMVKSGTPWDPEMA